MAFQGDPVHLTVPLWGGTDGQDRTPEQSSLLTGTCGAGGASPSPTTMLTAAPVPPSPEGTMC